MWKYYSAKTDKRGRNHELGDVGGLCSLDKADSLLWPPEKMQPGHPCMVRAILNFWQSEIFIQFSSVHSLSRVRLFVTPWTAALQASLSIINSQSLLKLMSIEFVMPYNHLILCHLLLLLPSIFPSIRVFSNESTLRMRWPKYWRFSLSISPSIEHQSSMISPRTDLL